MAQAFNSSLGQLIAPLVAMKRYKDALREIKILRRIDSALDDVHIRNARLLRDRHSLLSKLPHAGQVAEVGVADGFFSEQILEVCKPRTLHLIDFWRMNRAAHGFVPGSLSPISGFNRDDVWNKVNQKFQGEIKAERVRLHRGLSWDMLDLLPDESLDWIYIDAGHDYASVARDLAVARRKVKPEGFIAGHDYVKWGRHGYRCGVVEAVNEFCKRHDYELIYLTMETRTNASFAIRRIFLGDSW